MPLADFLRRGSAAVDTVTDNFDRANGPMGSTPVGNLAWNIVTGAWTIASNRAYTSTAASSNPIVVVDNGHSNIDMSINMGTNGNDCLYFRVIDANNWWRLRYYYNQTSDPYPIYCNTYSYTSPCIYSGSGCGVSQGGGCGSASGCGGCTGCGQSNGANCTCVINSCGSTGSVCSSYQCDTGYTTNYNYLFYLEKNVGGTITTVSTSTSRTSSSSAMRVTAVGSTITGYRDAAVSLFSATDSAHLNGTRHGVGRAAGGNMDSSAIDNFSLIKA